MALKCCRYCDAPLADGENAGRLGEFCSDEHRYEYQAEIQRDTVERLKRSEAAQQAYYQTVLQAGPPPGLMNTPALRGNFREAQGHYGSQTHHESQTHRDPNGERGTQTSIVLETATAPLVNRTAEASLAVVSNAAAPPAEAPPPIGHIEKTDNASLSNLLREARDRIAKDPAPTTTALAVRRKSRPGSKRPVPPNGATPQATANGNGTQAHETPELAKAVPVRPVVDIAIEPPPLTVPLRPQVQPSIGVASSPAAQPDYPSQENPPAKPSSDRVIEITPPTLAIPSATLMERIPWYVILVFLIAFGGGGYYYWTTTQSPPPPRMARPVMDEVKPLNMAPTEWVTVNAKGEDAFMAGRTLTLHKSSMELTDYRVEFVGSVDHRALGWALRMQDPGNYYAAKLRTNPTGKARLSFVRWKVVNGVPGPEAILPLEMRLPSNDQYTIKIDVRGDQIVTTLQGKVIDRWNEDTFSKGGFAYTNQNTERGRIVVTTIGMIKKSPAP
ncbi:MAG: hypothetical protein ABI972_25830 [Acidobacteriota bacterium]